MHGPVERAQPRLQVGDRHVELDGGQRPGQRRVRVPVDEDPVGAAVRDDLVQGGEHGADLRAVRARADAQVDIGGRYNPALIGLTLPASIRADIASNWRLSRPSTAPCWHVPR